MAGWGTGHGFPTWSHAGPWGQGGAQGCDTLPLSQVLTELKSDNQRLKDENGALIRVISKLSK